MKKIIKSTLAVASAIAMTFTMAAMPAVNVLAEDAASGTETDTPTPAPEPELYVPTDMADGEVHYTVAGGFGTVTWNPLAKDASMTPVEGIDGVYSFTAELPAYDEAAEWNNRFKICKIDNTVFGEGWDHSVCVGTTACGDNQSQIRILNATAGTYTIYFDTTTGGVVVKDEAGALVDLSISWVGYDNETQFMTPAEISASELAAWPQDKILTGITAVPDLASINAALADKLVKFVPSEMADGEVHYTVAGGFGKTTWTPLARDTEMKPVGYEDGVYAFTAELPAYDEEAEWNNRFKICKIDNTVFGEGWDHSLCVGTTSYADNQSQIRILNETAGTYTIYFDSKTGAVVVKDADGKLVNLSISWVGYDNETQFMTPEELSKTDLTAWPSDKIPAEVTAVPDLVKINETALVKFDPNYQPDTLKDGETYYTVAGGFGSATWTPLGKLNTMESTAWKNVYVFTAELPAYDETAEWNNRFKICKIDNTVLADGWDHSICVGTTAYGDNQSQIRILNATAGTYKIYFDAATGAVIVKDAAGALVDLSISWVGYDNETQFMTPAEIAASELSAWPQDKILTGITAVPNLVTINNALVDKLSKEPVKASLSVKVSTKTLYTGKSGNAVTIKATVKGDSKKVTWKSSKPSVATVNSKGKVTAKKAGRTVISIRANGITKKITITVKNPTITVKNGSKKVSSTISLKKGKSVKLSVATKPSKAGFKAACANSSSKKLIKVSTKGSKVTVKAVKKGTAKIKITSGGASKTITVKVK